RGEEGEAAGDERRVAAIRPQRLHQRSRACRHHDALVIDLLQHLLAKPRQHFDAGAKSVGEFELALHGLLGDRGDFGFQPGEIGKLVNALDGDHGAVHIGEEQLLAAAFRLLHAIVNARWQRRRLNRRFCRVKGEAAEREINSVIVFQPVGAVNRSTRVGKDAAGRFGKIAQCRAGCMIGDEGENRILYHCSRQQSLMDNNMTAERRQAGTILLAGPTASGKSALAIAIAEEFDGVIINADSMQIYSGLRVLTARPSADEEARVPHRLYGILDPADDCTAARWRDMALDESRAATAAGKLPVAAGGTGLYFDILTNGIAEIPEISKDVRDRLRELQREAGNEVIHAMLTAKDPEMAARLNVGDTQRLLRALEVVEETGVPLTDWQRR